jgi:hypothetical protein
MQKLPRWIIFVEIGLVLATGALTYWIMTSVPLMSRRFATGVAVAAMLIYSIALLCVHRVRRVRGPLPPTKGPGSVGLRSAKYVRAGVIAGLLGGACLILGLYGLLHEILPMAVPSVMVSGGLASLALWLIRRGLPR